MRLATRLGAIELRDDTGRSQRLADTWQDQPAVLVFLRHFG